MHVRRWYQLPLARKISLLFGTAVLLTIAVTLSFPLLQMNALNEQAILIQAKRVAAIARQAVDLRQPDWQAAQRRLNGYWTILTRDLDLPSDPPRLVAVDTLVGRGFLREALAHLERHPHERYYWRTQGDGHVFRLAMAVRATEADPYPRALLGIIDVELKMPPAYVWNWAVTILAGASGCVLAILVFYIVTQRLVLSPVNILRRLAEKVTSGDINVRSSIESGDEFESLSDAFNDMLAHLKAAQEEQQKINRSLDIRLGELAETNVALYESNRLKSEFLTNVTHELRTPLVSIIGFAELLRDAWENPDADRQRLARYSEHIVTSARGLLDIINDLLDLAKIEAGKIERHVSEFALDELCRDLVDFARPLADKRNQRLTLEIADGLPRCRTDSGKLKQILYNLLSNAIKFTPTGGSITLSASPVADGRVRLAVTDTGPGIPEDQHESIFEQFRQLDSSASREHGGTGLGLTITRELVQMLGGTIRLKSEVGRGSTFIVEVPALIGEPATSWGRA